MRDRAVEIAGFLAQKGWEDAYPVPMDADLSPRRYARLENNRGKRVILMDADPDQKTAQFVAIAKALRECGTSAPEIFAADPVRGFVLMEDFGDRNFGRMIDGGAERTPFYRRAVNVLVRLHGRFDKSMLVEADIPTFNAVLFASQVELFLDAYIPYSKDREATAEERESFGAAWKEALKNIDTLPQSLLLRDYMPDNMMDLPERENWHSTGVLDFQDGGIGPAAYDLASLCEVVRRDGGDALLDEMIGHYHAKAQPPLSVAELRTACHVLSAQRHMRILGIVTRHALKTGRREKLGWLPRIKRFLEQALEPEEALNPVKKWAETHKALG